jgi:predicted AAA+ superfamily ATPase
MVFLSGPRQCGKTTLAQGIGQEATTSYFNWDVAEHRRLLRAGRIEESAKLWIFDELHKFRQWRNWLKGLYDLHHQNHQILVTGSGRLELYSRGGDSLQGRYFLHRLHPFTLSEWLDLPAPDIATLRELPAEPPAGAAQALEDMLRRGGFPEPLLSGSQRQADRWRLAYGQRLIRDDVRTLELIRDLDRLELLYERLPDLVGSVLSINSLREDLEVAFETVRSWLSVFDRLFVCFRLPPFGTPRIKAVKKEQKLYLWDWSRPASAAARLENLVALHLLRLQHWCEDVLGQRVEARYFRDVHGHEVDFVMLKDKKPWMAVEVKSSEQTVDPGLKYFLERVRVPYAFQISLSGQHDFRAPDINGCKVRVLPAAKFLANLP